LLALIPSPGALGEGHCPLFETVMYTRKVRLNWGSFALRNW
jgi:hypothetical protein